MKRLISLKLVLILLLSSVSPFISISPAQAQNSNQSTCENGECVDGMIDRLQDLGAIYQRECLPSEDMRRDLEEYYKQNGLSEKCWKLITEINHLENQLQRHQTRLEERLGCQGGNCNFSFQDQSLGGQLSALTKVEQNLSCTEPKKKGDQSKMSSGDELCSGLLSARHRWVCR